jgi:choline dehydrogenase
MVNPAKSGGGVKTTADYVIVGAGSAGAALACRLSEDGRHRVIVIEDGGSDIGPLIQMPLALAYPLNMKRYDWGYRSEPEPQLNGRRLACPRGRVIGGSSSINGMVYVRGHAQDFDSWEQMGATGWGAAAVAPYFRRLETAHGLEPGEGRGTDGPLHVTRGSSRNPLFAAFLRAGVQAGYPATEDYNGRQQEGFCAFEATIWQGRRWSTATAYLRPALKRPNCRLIRANARRIVFDGRRATGVEISGGGRLGGKAQIIHAAREVIIAASAINAPKLLMLSGIGPAEHLAERGIPVVADRPGVGANLQDHMELYIQTACRQPITLNGHLGLLARARVGLEWLLFKRGLGASNQFEAGAFLRSSPEVPYPDIQIHFLPGAIRYDGNAAAAGHGFQLHIGPMRSKSRGHVRLADDPQLAPKITFNYLTAPDDMADFRRCIRLARTIVAQPAFDAFRAGEIAPGPAVQSDADLDAFIRAHAESAYHPCGTCRMGAASDRHAVVDPACRVIGVDALRVADSSVFPQITYGNLNAPSIMVGEKAADHILGRV